VRYLNGGSVFHRLDARTKIFLSLTLACLIVILNTAGSLFVLFILLLGGFFLIRPPASYIRTMLYLMTMALFATLISQGLFYYFEPRTPIFTIIRSDTPMIGGLTGGVYLYREGLFYGAIQSMRLFSAALLSMIIVMTTYPSDLIFGLNKLGIPEKLGFMLTISIRFLPLFMEGTKRIIIAQKLRGLRLKGLRGGIKGLRYLIVPLTIDCLRKARRIALAAEVRGFTGKRTEIKELRFTFLDWIALIIMPMALALAIWQRFI
jgi:energy-coupling factor transport system permease protein